MTRAHMTRGHMTRGHMTRAHGPAARLSGGLVPAVLAAVLSAALAACAAGPGTSSVRGPTAGAPPSAGPAAPAVRLDVFAAASLTDVFAEIAPGFTDAHPTVEVVVNTAGSSTLATQIVQGAPADVFASADPAQMQVVADADRLAGPASVFATNDLAIVVEAGNPLGIGSLADLATPDVTTVLAAPAVPAGAYARQALRRAGVSVTAASQEPSVRAVLSRVALGEADAGIVYATDVAAADDVAAVRIPAAVNVTASYVAAPVGEGVDGEGVDGDAQAAEAFVAHLRRAPAQRILRAQGFGPPGNTDGAAP